MYEIFRMLKDLPKEAQKAINEVQPNAFCIIEEASEEELTKWFVEHVNNQKVFMMSVTEAIERIQDHIKDCH